MMNNLQKDLQENVEKYNGKHHLHKRVKVINCYHCYPISTEANVPDNFIRFWDWISIFHLAKSCTSLTLFYFEKVIKARAGRNRNAIISNISELCQTIIFDSIPIEIDEVGNSIEQILIFRNNFEKKNIKTSGNSPSTSRSESSKITRKFKIKYSKSPCYVFLTLQRCEVAVLPLLDRELYCFKLTRDYVTTLINFKGWFTTTKVS